VVPTLFVGAGSETEFLAKLFGFGFGFGFGFVE
jgi:hypothetical protein